MNLSESDSDTDDAQRAQRRVEDIFQHVLTTIQADDDNPDVMVLCRNEEIVQTRRSLLSLYSPVFRSMMGSIPGGTRSDMEMVMMPDYSRPVVENMIKILMMDWSDRDTWGLEVKEIMTELNITVGRFFEKEVERKEIVETIVKDISSEMCEESLPVLNDPSPVPTPDPQPGINSDNKKRVHKAKCPMSNCSRQFTGAKIKYLEELLKSHIGLIHFNKELLNLIEREYFVNSNNCKGCGKFFSTKTQMKKHLVLNHTKYVNEAMKLVNKAIEKSNDDFDSSKCRLFNQNLSKQDKDKNQFKCSFDCNKNWNMKNDTLSRIKIYMRHHIMSHFGQRFKPFQREYFKNKLCLECPQLKKPIKNNSLEISVR